MTKANMQADLKSQFQANEYQHILIDNQEQGYLKFDSNLQMTRATIVLIANAEETASNGLLYQLAKQLPDVGVSVLFFHKHLSDKIAAQTTDMATTDITDTQSDSVESGPAEGSQEQENSFAVSINAKQYQSSVQVEHISDCSETLNSMLSAAIAELNLSKERLVLLSHGFISACIFEIKEFPGNGIVTIDPFVNNTELNKRLSTAIAQTGKPVLEFNSTTGNHWANSAAKDRQIQVNRSHKVHYRQREMVGKIPVSMQASHLATEIYGWLTYLGY